MTAFTDIARAAWGPDAPEWVMRLAEECEKSSQNKVAKQIKRSAALVSNVLRGKYGGDLVAVEDLVRGAFMAETIDCPALGPIPKHECRDWRGKAAKFSAHNALRVQMFRACNRCPVHNGEDQ
jgi:hypothetical protein